MYFQAVSLTQFRNYAYQEITFHASGNVFFGVNGQGKTNLLEAIHCLCVGKSSRNARDAELINHQSRFYRLTGVGYRHDESRVEVELAYEKPNRKSLKINGQARKAISDLVGHFSVVSFSPEDIAIVNASPQHRRRFLDIALSQTYRTYLLNLQEYQQILEQRNAILKKIQFEPNQKTHLSDQLSIWDQQLVETGAKIILHRQKATAFFNQVAQQIHQKISNDVEYLKCKYDVSFAFENDDQIAEQFRLALKKNWQRDQQRGYTTIGPHRDDLQMTLNDMDLRTYGSQGQQRTASVSLRIAEAEWIANKTNEKPILLIDEVFAELDLKRTNQLLTLFQNYGQVFIATARDDDLARCPTEFRRFKIENGKVEAC